MNYARHIARKLSISQLRAMFAELRARGLLYAAQKGVGRVPGNKYPNIKDFLKRNLTQEQLDKLREVYQVPQTSKTMVFENLDRSVQASSQFEPGADALAASYYGDAELAKVLSKKAVRVKVGDYVRAKLSSIPVHGSPNPITVEPYLEEGLNTATRAFSSDVKRFIRSKKGPLNEKFQRTLFGDRIPEEFHGLYLATDSRGDAVRYLSGQKRASSDLERNYLRYLRTNPKSGLAGPSSSLSSFVHNIEIDRRMRRALNSLGLRSHLSEYSKRSKVNKATRDRYRDILSGKV